MEKGEMLIRRWESSVIPKLKRIVALEKGSVTTLLDQNANCNDVEKCYTMLQVLTHLLPPTAGRSAVSSRCSIKSAITYLLDFVPCGTRISSLCDTGDIAAKGQQPQLVCIGNLTSEAHQFFIVARNNKVVIPLEDESLTCALDKLFKFYWVYNLLYPPQLASVFIFLEYVYDLSMSNTARRSKVLELISKLQALA